MVAAVLAVDVVDDLAAAVDAEVDVDIGHAHALGVEKALEIKAVFYGVDVGYAQRVGHDAARGGASARADGYFLRLCVAYEVRDDEKIVHKAHFVYHLKLVVELAFDRAVVIGIALGKPLHAELAQILKAVALALGQTKARQLVMAELKIVIAHIRDLRRVVGGLGILRKQLAHLLLVLDVKLFGLKLHARGVGDRFLHLDAHEHVLIIRVLFLKVVRVVGKREGYARLAVEPQQPLGSAVLDLKAVILDLKIKALRPEKLVKLKGFFLRALVVSRGQHPRYRSGGAAGKADKPRRVLMQQLPVDARLYIEALGEGRGHKIAQVFIALLVSAQQD